MGNLLRQGGLYGSAWQYVDRAQRQFRDGLPSHDTELAHCYYSKAVCVAVTGLSDFDAPFPEDASENTRLFAGALIKLTYSHAAWFLDDIEHAKQYAADAARAFSDLGLTSYANRAAQVTALLTWWRKKGAPEGPVSDHRLAKLVAILQGADRDVVWLQRTFSSLRPSLAAGLLQFARENVGLYRAPLAMSLPRVLHWRDDGCLEWRTGLTAGSLEEADHMLREHLAVPIERRIPLLAD
jgi:hypothetical protein